MSGPVAKLVGDKVGVYRVCHDVSGAVARGPAVFSAHVARSRPAVVLQATAPPKRLCHNFSGTGGGLLKDPLSNPVRGKSRPAHTRPPGRGRSQNALFTTPPSTRSAAPVVPEDSGLAT